MRLKEIILENVSDIFIGFVVCMIMVILMVVGGLIFLGLMTITGS